MNVFISRGVTQWLPLCMLISSVCLLPCVASVFGYGSGQGNHMLHDSMSKMHSQDLSSSSSKTSGKSSLSDYGSGSSQMSKKGSSQEHHDSAPLDSVERLHFYKGRQSSHRRSYPVPQLQCKEGCDTFEPTMVQCTNSKLPDQERAVWRCETDLPRHLKFEKTAINCEGFESPDDKRILRGSCGLEYSLASSGLKPIPGRVHRHFYSVVTNPQQDDGMQGWTASWLIVIGVVLYLIKHNLASLKSAEPTTEGLHSKVVTARQAWKSGTSEAAPK